MSRRGMFFVLTLNQHLQHKYNIIRLMIKDAMFIGDRGLTPWLSASLH